MPSAALAYDMTSALRVDSDILGPLSVDVDAVITFPQGLLGFPECRSFVLLPAEREHLYWLQSIDYSSLAFLTIDPFVFFEGYSVDLSAPDAARIGGKEDEVTVLSIVTLPSQRGGTPSANLQGPVLLNSRSRQGQQVVIPESRYGIREAVAL